MNYWEEEQRQKTMRINYKLGKYTEKDCLNCGELIESYQDIPNGLCENCKENIDNY